MRLWLPVFDDRLSNIRDGALARKIRRRCLRRVFSSLSWTDIAVLCGVLVLCVTLTGVADSLIPGRIGAWIAAGVSGVIAVWTFSIWLKRRIFRVLPEEFALLGRCTHCGSSDVSQKGLCARCAANGVIGPPYST